ncbi:MAG: reverse transcriptase domain-containing protein [Caldilineales bacterium]
MASLFDQAVQFENLQRAWESTRDKGQTPGVDDWTTRRFARNWEENLRRLMADVRAHRYQCKRLRVRMIPKRASPSAPSARIPRKRPLRRLGIPALRDRILQRAVLQVIAPRLDRQFLSCSYGYRPKRSLFQAVAAILRYRDRGHGWLLDADIDNCFDSLHHEVLWPLIEQAVPDSGLLSLFRQWLDVGMVNRAERRGVSQGMPVSPLLCNLYLHQLDYRLAVHGRWALVRYADDFVVLTRSREQAEQCREVTAAHLAELRLSLQAEKTGVASFHDGFDFLGVHFQGDSYRYVWQDKEIEVSGDIGPLWSMGRYFPHGYA